MNEMDVFGNGLECLKFSTGYGPFVRWDILQLIGMNNFTKSFLNWCLAENCKAQWT